MKEKYCIPIIKAEELNKNDVLCDSKVEDNAQESYSLFNYLTDFISGNG